MERDEKKYKEILLYNDTEKILYCAWYQKDVESGYHKRIKELHSALHPQKATTIQAHATAGPISTLSKWIGLSSTPEPFLVIRPDRGELDWEISNDYLDNLKNNATIIVKNFLYSNHQGFQKGSYLIAYSAEQRLQCKSKSLKFLTLYNKTECNRYCAWYLFKAANRIYTKCSPITSIDESRSAKVFCRTSEGSKSLINLAQHTLLGAHAEPILLITDTSENLHNSLSEEETNDNQYVLKDFTTSNWERFQKGDFFICKKNPLDPHDTTLSCDSQPKTITIVNTQECPIHFVLYADTDIGKNSTHAFAVGKHFGFSVWEAVVQRNSTIEIPNPAELKEEQTLYFSSNPKLLTTDNLPPDSTVQVAVLVCALPLSHHQYYVYKDDNATILTLKPYEETN
jgi:hypothetical protein